MFNKFAKRLDFFNVYDILSVFLLYIVQFFILFKNHV